MASEEGRIVAAAIDYFFRETADTRPDTIRNPRLLRDIYPQPFEALVLQRVPPVGQLDGFVNFHLKRLRTGSAVVDAADVVARDNQLSPGGPLIIVAPVSWRGDSVAVARFAIYDGSLHKGAEAFVRVEYREGAWHGVRVDNGRVH